MIRFVACLVALALTGAAQAASKPDPYFQNLTHELKAHGIGHPVVLLDLDRLDHNIDVLKSHIQPPWQYRATEKSLPSIDLLKYIMQRTGSDRIMAFHHPFLKILLTQLPDDTDILFGKTIPIAGVKEVLADLTADQKQSLSQRVSWLIDSPDTMQEFLKVFQTEGIPFKVNIEIDVGLHRGGMTNLRDFYETLALIAKNSQTVTLTGLMGYDAQVSVLPDPLKEPEIKKVNKIYSQYVDALKSNYPELYATAHVFDGAGSETYTLYKPGTTPINDFAVGSGLLKASDSDISTLKEHVPAIYIATPVLKKLHPAKLAILGKISLNPKVNAYYVYGGDWSNTVEYPKGIHGSFLTNSTPNRNTITNQSFLYGDPNDKLEVGDFVFYRPVQSDAFFSFEDIWLVRGGKIIGKWKPFDRRF